MDHRLAVAPLAAGAMATVYLGKCVRPGGFSRTVAVKRLHPHLHVGAEGSALNRSYRQPFAVPLRTASARSIKSLRSATANRDSGEKRDEYEPHEGVRIPRNASSRARPMDAIARLRVTRAPRGVSIDRPQVDGYPAAHGRQRED